MWAEIGRWGTEAVAEELEKGAHKEPVPRANVEHTSTGNGHCPRARAGTKAPEYSEYSDCLRFQI
jgi:hypothetical protein